MLNDFGFELVRKDRKVLGFLPALLALKSSEGSVLIEFPMRRRLDLRDYFWEHGARERLVLDVVLAELGGLSVELDLHIKWVLDSLFKNVLEIPSLRHTKRSPRRHKASGISQLQRHFNELSIGRSDALNERLFLDLP
jgi:hypothetical protein